MSVFERFQQGFRRHRSAWFVGGVFVLLIVFGLMWRGLYLYFLDEQIEQHEITEALIVKSELIENLIISARNRSVLVSQLLFQNQPQDPRFAELVNRFEQEAVNVIDSRQKYLALADDYERRILNQHYELASLNRSQQDYLLALQQEGEHDLAVHEYVASTLPVQEQALALLDALHAHVAKMREVNKLRIDEHTDILTRIVTYSTSFYLLLLLALAVFVVWRLVKMSRVQGHLQDQLNNQLVATTVAYEQADKELIRLAHYDTVTDLLNRRCFEKQLNELLEQSPYLSLLFIDLDNFKWFNDTLGHAAGDALLQRFAEALTAKDSPVSQAPMGRLGGDEFGIVLVEATQESEEAAVRYILASIAELDEHYGPAKPLNASIGIARYPDHAQVADLLMRFADMAMYEAKSQGKGQSVLFNSSLLQVMYDELDLEQALRHALHERQIQVFYQAQYRLSDLSLSGAEALVRWQRFGQWVSPAVMIPLAEKTGQIHQLGLQVLDRVLSDLANWDAQGKSMPKIAVNVSAVQMRMENMHDDFTGRIQQSGLDKTRIEAEITESVFADMEVCSTFIHHLCQRNIRIALDDFGTGYSSLSQITNLKIDKLKIDQSFVAQLGHNEQVGVLVKTIIRMGHSLGLVVLAEGIETLAQYEQLKAWGCDEGQGYLFARPVPADQFSFAPLDATQLSA